MFTNILRKSAATAVILLAIGPSLAEEPRQPQAAERMPLAHRAIVNDMARAGDRIVAVGERGHILVSDDDGESWQQMPSPVRAMLTSVAFLDARHGWAVGHDGSALFTDDGGDSWQLRHFDSEWGRPFYDMHFESPERGLIAGANGRMLKTEDGGQSWHDVDSDVLATGFNIYQVTELNDGTLVIAGERGFMARSSDGGERWEMIDPPYIGSYFGALPVGESGVLFYGLQGRVFLAQDVHQLARIEDPFSYDPFVNESITDPALLELAGWKLYGSTVAQSLFGGIRLDDGRFLMVGVDGLILTAREDEAALHRLDSPTGEPLSSALVLGDRLLLGGRIGFAQRELP